MRLFSDVWVATLERYFIEMCLANLLIELWGTDVRDRSIGIGGKVLHRGCWLVYDHLRLSNIWLKGTFCHFLNQNLFLSLFNLWCWLILTLEKLLIPFPIAGWISTCYAGLWSIDIRLECLVRVWLRRLACRSVTSLSRVLLCVELLEREYKLTDTP